MATWKLTMLSGLLLAGGVVSARSGGWQWFRSSRGFVVKYPSSWFRVGSSLDRLEIRSSKGGAEGVIIKHGQADIGVIEAPDSAGSDLDKAARYYTREASVLSRRNVPVSPGRHGCEVLMEVIFKEPIIPIEDAAAKVPVAVNALLLCKIDHRAIVTLQRNFEGDRRQDYYRRVAVRMASSIAVVSK